MQLARASDPLEVFGKTVKPIADTAWRGLTEYYSVLWQEAGRPEAKYHTGWMRDLGIDPEGG
jgi:hypothetical protein